MSWNHKHQPRTFDKVDFGEGNAQKLKKMALDGDFPHLLCHGPSGAGKRTQIFCLLNKFFGRSVHSPKLHRYVFDTPNGKQVEIHGWQSPHHIEITPTDATKKYDALVIREVVNVFTKNTNWEKKFKVILIRNGSGLSQGAQTALSRIMSDPSRHLRIIVLSQSLSDFSMKFRSHLLHLRYTAPSNDELYEMVFKVFQAERFGFEDDLPMAVATESKFNARKALLLAEACKVKEITSGASVPQYDWIAHLQQTARQIVHRQDSDSVLSVRNRLTHLVLNMVPTNQIFQVLHSELEVHCFNPELKSTLAQLCADFEHRSCIGTQPMIHLEAFFIEFMIQFATHSKNTKNSSPDSITVQDLKLT